MGRISLMNLMPIRIIIQVNSAETIESREQDYSTDILLNGQIVWVFSLAYSVKFQRPRPLPRSTVCMYACMNVFRRYRERSTPTGISIQVRM